MPGFEMTFEQKVLAFWSKVNKEGPIPIHHPEMSPCWIWEGFTNTEGERAYGAFCIGGKGGGRRNHKAHRVAWFMTYGYWPTEIDHLCHVTRCVRVTHMREVQTHKENMANRRCSKICKRGHPLADPNLYYINTKKYGRKHRCLTCWKSEQVRLKERRLAAKAGRS